MHQKPFVGRALSGPAEERTALLSTTDLLAGFEEGTSGQVIAYKGKGEGNGGEKKEVKGEERMEWNGTRCFLSYFQGVSCCVNPFNASCSKLLLFEGLSAILV